MKRVGSIVFALLLISCGEILSTDDDVVVIDKQPSRTIEIANGQQLEIIVYAPTGYLSPPEINSPVVSFLGMGFEGCCTPGGAPQRFRFMAVEKGTSTITFRTSSHDDRGIIQDTVFIR